MLKLNALHSEKVWGYENWIASVHPVLSHEEFVSECGKDYPLLVKVIQANEYLSVQVHPDDEAAVKLEGVGNRGKTECWYVLDAEPDAKLVFGLKNDSCKKYERSELERAIEKKSFEDYLNYVNVKKGDFVFIPAGTVHAIGGGLRLLEVQQSCDLTYRLYDWGRPREIHVQKGLSVIKEDNLLPIAQFDKEFECQYFSLEKIKVSGGYSMLCSHEKQDSRDWQLLFVISGEGTVKNADGASFGLKAEDLIAVKPGEKITVEGRLELMKIKCR
ncbi:type I phosphomannose isomerase catalytic subunit [Treponema sp.]|uniref:type I phosphomannose isomerase catalytic subunit n=1 Tax=Treponema sp. TaxID=166 RepID=UPI00298DB594|nr:type I phosphomannose isomerase catalytic subunit [Treponema sp.]MCR5612166.1 class I mannose-6-phosphate isomerase [Treponema sp.]